MSDVLFLYKKLTMSGSMDLGEDALKFSVILSKEYGDMLQELTERSALSRAQIARMLICTALDEIDTSYNLKNDDNFDSDITRFTEEQLEELNEARVHYEMDKEENRIGLLRMAIETANPQTAEEHEFVKRAQQEIEEHDNKYNSKDFLMSKLFSKEGANNG